MLGDEIHKMGVHQFRHVRLVLQRKRLAIDPVFLALRLGVPVDPAALEGQIIVETKILGSERELAPLADRRGDITCRFQ